MTYHLEHMLISDYLEASFIDYATLIKFSRSEANSFSPERLRRLTSTLLSKNNQLSDIREVQFIMTNKAFA